jgi:hypothetical protein
VRAKGPWRCVPRHATLNACLTAEQPTPFLTVEKPELPRRCHGLLWLSISQPIDIIRCHVIGAS